MRAKNIDKRAEYLHRQPKATDAELDAVAPVLPLSAFKDLVMRVLEEANDTCGLCGGECLRIQLVEDVDGKDFNRATMQRIQPAIGYTEKNVMLLCLACNRYEPCSRGA